MDFDISTPTYAHDANGNLTSDGVFAYAYDAANQLTNVVRLADGARVLSARYDALGRRVEATRADGTVDRYVYFPGSLLVLAVLDETNAPKEFYTRGPDLSGSLDGAGGIGGILAVTDSSSVVRYSHADIMGNVIALTDASGSVVSTFRYTPFGQLSARTGSVFPRYLFSSKEFDRTANLYYYGYRYYAPRLGRWMTRDPIGEEGGQNLYEFVGNKPISSIDFLGTFEIRIPGLTQLARRLWLEVIHDVLEPILGWDVAAFLFEHSLQDYPSDLHLNQTHFVSRAIIASTEYENKLSEIVRKQHVKYQGYVVVDNIIFETGD